MREVDNASSDDRIKYKKTVRQKRKLLAIIFISHSKRDAELVLVVKKLLENVGHTPIIEEFVLREEKADPPYEEIRRNVEKSALLFLFLTDNVIATDYTRNWVIYEVGLAAKGSKKLFVFERLGTPIYFPIPYLTDYALFDMDKTGDILMLQKLAKDLGKFPRDLLTAGTGAAIGSLFGPAGVIFGAVMGYLVGPKLPKPLTVKCNHCNIDFNYYSTRNTFSCPSCRRDIDLR